eukprot:6308488-Pyramimonas_sp.AAC.1
MMLGYVFQNLIAAHTDQIRGWKNDILEIAEDPDLGRTVRARVDIPAGSLILSEPPLAITVPLDELEEEHRHIYQEVK